MIPRTLYEATIENRRRTLTLPRQAVVIGTLLAVDAFAAAASLVFASFLLNHSPLTVTEQLAPYALAWLWPFVYWREGLYPGYGIPRHVKLKKYFVGAALAGLLLTALLPALQSGTHLTLFPVALATLISGALGYTLRILAQRFLRSVHLWGKPVVILGAGVVGSDLTASLQQATLTGLTPVALFDDDPAKHGRSYGGIPVRGGLADAADYARRYNIHQAIVAISRIPHDVLAALTSTEAQVFKELTYLPDMPGLPVHGVRSGVLHDRLALEIRNNLRLRRNQIVKRAFDLVAAGLGTLFISPLLLLLALAIRLDSAGPVLYSQERIGRNGERFRIWKFRSMVADADEALERYLAENPELRAQWEAAHKLPDDPRITRVGGFLRSTSLDELPQLLNVLRGEMSLVGPRPIVDAEISRYGQKFDLYTLVRPGMTGYWQVSGRSDTSYERRVALDEFYTRNWSVWLDVVVLIATVKVVLNKEGAY